MKARKLYQLILCSVVGIGPVLFLFFRSNSPYNPTDNFIRLTPPHSLTLVKRIQLAAGNYYFAGTTGNSLYLIAANLPLQIQKVDTNFSRVTLINLRLPDSTNLYAAHTCVTAYNEVLLFDGFKPAVMKTTLPDTEMTIHFLKKDYYLKAIPLAANSFIFQKYDSLLEQNIFIKYNPDRGEFLSYRYAPDKGSDGVFSLDGMLRYDPLSNKLLYVYFYKNQFDCLDTNLNKLYMGKTIDSNKTAKVYIIKSNEGGTGAITASSTQVNKGSWIADNRLYVHSLIAGKNENPAMMKSYDMIDIYAVSTGEYIQSLAAEKYKEQNLNGFIVIADHFYGLYKNHLVDYTIKRIRPDIR